MNASRRPGGLTALAVINFVYAGISILGILGMVVLRQLVGDLKQGASLEEQRIFEAVENMSIGVWGLIVVSSLVAIILLIVAGVGYLKMRRWGWLVGNAYVLTAFVSSALTVALMPAELGGGFNFGTIIGVVYPMLTLILLNTTFKHDLTTRD